MITVATLFWEPSERSARWSRAYTVEWVEKLYRGFARNLTGPFRFVVFTDRLREYGEPIEQELLTNPAPGYGDCLEPYRLGAPMILVGLDTIVTGNVDHLAEYCLTADRIALPLDPYEPTRVCNGVALVPAGWERVWTEHDHNTRPQADMERLRRLPHAVLDTLFPGQVVSFKGHVREHGLGDARIVYFHGPQKAPELDDPWIAEHWR
ncbi:hypothetical protein [Marinicauda sp. Alg238-R41]|uniref:hypothetical protein n=1 Tax=Marinicauda sp. Alg238-R41 TaxID=2993447 RepID=UPI0022DF75F7|nr:hypothetical protein [Marinicauda sp. Alg238-R41]